MDFSWKINILEVNNGEKNISVKYKKLQLIQSRALVMILGKFALSIADWRC